MPPITRNSTSATLRGILSDVLHALWRGRLCTMRVLPNVALVLSLTFAPVFASAQEQTWKINLKNADINEFVSQIAAITGKTFVVDPRVKGKVTVISNASLNEHDVYELFL